MRFMEIVFIYFFISYCCITIGLTIGWIKSVRKKRFQAVVKEQYRISVIVPARNEAKVIADLLRDLRQQAYKNFEVIVIDDHSTDATVQIAREIIQADARLRIIPNTNIGKKSALTTGISNANGDVIVTTDADCRVDPEWLTAINQNFQNPEVKMLIGAVKIEADGSLFSAMQAMEFASLVGSGVATLFFGFPTMCNGANLAFKKHVFEEVNGYDDNLHIASGDDEFLMKKIHRKYPTGVQFMGLTNAIVSTAPQAGWNALFHQRIRWAGKWRYKPTIQKTLLALYIFLFQLITLLSPPLVLLGWLPGPLVLLFWMIRMTIELLFLWSIVRSTQGRWNWLSFVILELFYSLYVVVIGLLCNVRTYTWKERRLQSGKEKTG